MSRTRIIGGKYTKMIGGNYYINSNENISLILGNKVFLNAKGGVHRKDLEIEEDSNMKQILSAEWIPNTSNEKLIEIGDKVSILVKTRNYKKDEIIKISIKNTFNNDDIFINGKVDEKGEVLVQNIYLNLI
ncbi:hypothetical protein B0A78_14060 [Flavobacterium columnare NBRC 100251 = ATCC 23463]|uniref:hypothetical protein n=1 Tax=Flavobacterium columnare TaxID=996 RepID=UPI0007F9B758|nr:hypothetical protein [Flavobacterium columnare]ANO48714.1 hypothetical protein Pf1_00466 [Flavobacterium columnare]APT23250.1 hypothetical protein BU993_11840 [Flavobacterium columnare]PDS21665.1 hypothetical protein B0A78_14060 [Flavobacterium columnare NBRC 100251 = ATCC 23463]GEM59259.1 hypothetical protein FC1_24970 [Flavobacterium columnare NBRC 100251 = ATCC 23463]